VTKILGSVFFIVSPSLFNGRVQTEESHAEFL
jgi:hypothetical protein